MNKSHLQTITETGDGFLSSLFLSCLVDAAQQTLSAFHFLPVWLHVRTNYLFLFLIHEVI